MPPGEISPTSVMTGRVPARKVPTPRLLSLFEQLPADVLLYTFLYLRTCDLGILCSSSHRLCAVLDNDFIWRELFLHAWPSRLHTSLFERPTGLQTLGRAVRVYDETRRCFRRTAWVERFDVARDEYLLRYDDTGESRWESEIRRTGPWHARGKSRFDFALAGVEALSSCLSSSLAASSAPQLLHESWRSELKSNAVHVPSGRAACVLREHTDEVLDLSFSHNGRMLATCSRDLSTIVYSVRRTSSLREGPRRGGGFRFKQRYRLPSRESCVCRVAWSPEDNVLITCTEDSDGNPFDPGRIELWHGRTGVPLGVVASLPFDVHACWFPCGRRFVAGEMVEFGAAGNFTQRLAIWGVKDLICPLLRITLSHPGTNFAHFVQIGVDGQTLFFASGDNPYLCHKVYALELTGVALDAIRSDPEQSSGASGVEEIFLDTVTLPSFDIKGAILSIKLSRDGARLFVNVRPFTDEVYYKQATQLWSATDPDYKSDASLCATRRTFAGMDPDAAFEATAPDIACEAEVQIWDPASRSLLYRLNGHLGFTTKQCPRVINLPANVCPTFACLLVLRYRFLLFCDEDPTESYLASGSEDGLIYIWHMRHRRLLRALRGHSENVSSVSFNTAFPGLLASASDDHTVRIWTPCRASEEDAPEGERRRALSVGEEEDKDAANDLPELNSTPLSSSCPATTLEERFAVAGTMSAPRR